MSADTFTRAFGAFRDRVSDLVRTHRLAWDTRLRRLVRHCENDPVMQTITRKLRAPHRIRVEVVEPHVTKTISEGQYGLCPDQAEKRAVRANGTQQLRHGGEDRRRESRSDRNATP